MPDCPDGRRSSCRIIRFNSKRAVRPFGRFGCSHHCTEVFSMQRLFLATVALFAATCYATAGGVSHSPLADCSCAECSCNPLACPDCDNAADPAICGVTYTLGGGGGCANGACQSSLSASTLSSRAPVGHTHTCPRCGTTWDHQSNAGHNCPNCGAAQYVQDSFPRAVTVRTTTVAAPVVRSVTVRTQSVSSNPLTFVVAEPIPPAVVVRSATPVATFAQIGGGCASAGYATATRASYTYSSGPARSGGPVRRLFGRIFRRGSSGATITCPVGVNRLDL
jgi:uncharacterized protein (DUF983 family)